MPTTSSICAGACRKQRARIKRRSGLPREGKSSRAVRRGFAERARERSGAGVETVVAVVAVVEEEEEEEEEEEAEEEEEEAAAVENCEAWSPADEGAASSLPSTSAVSTSDIPCDAV
jgi:hypothetical protein